MAASTNATEGEEDGEIIQDRYRDQLEGIEDEGQAFDEDKHAHLLNSLRALDGKKGRLLQRSEHAAKATEYHKRAGEGSGSSEAVSLAELVGALRHTTSHGDLKKQLRTAQARNHVLDEPLAKPANDRLQRGVAYETTAKEVTKWEPVVEVNRRADQLHFPLQQPDTRLPAADGFVHRFQPRTPLELEVAALLGNSEHVLTRRTALTKAEERALRAMSVEEARRRRAELQKHRALLSYKEAKAHRQNKIKSKRYHRILRKEKQKKEEKTLQALESTDPEAHALYKDKMDKMRIQERISLRHRGGSKFAKDKAHYGKFDDISRQAVADMYEQSHRLTEKTRLPEEKDEGQENVGPSDEDEEETLSGVTVDGNGLAKANSVGLHRQGEQLNPWLSAGPTKAGQTEKRVQSSRDSSAVVAAVDFSNSIGSAALDTPQPPLGDCTSTATSISSPSLPVCSGADVKGPQQQHGAKNALSKSASAASPLQRTAVGSVKRAQTVATGADDCLVTSSVDEIFSALDECKVKVQDEPSATPPASKRARRKRKSKNADNGSSGEQDFARQRKAVDTGVSQSTECIRNDNTKADEELSEEEMMTETLERRQTLNDIETALLESSGATMKAKMSSTAASGTSSSELTNELQTTKAGEEKKSFKAAAAVQRVVAHTLLPSVVVANENGEDESQEQQRMNIAEAFADDDVVEEFSREKRAAEEQGKPKDIDLTLPGWGDWGGAGVLPATPGGAAGRRRRARRFIIKAPPAQPRQDRNLENAIISESKDTSVSKHQVSELPFPFSSVQQFESSIRMPIGKTWNPESAYRSMIEPRIKTKLGTIIDPIDESEVYKNEQKRKSRKADGGGKSKAGKSRNPGSLPGAKHGPRSAAGGGRKLEKQRKQKVNVSAAGTKKQ